MDRLRARRLFAIVLAVGLPLIGFALGAGAFAFAIAAGTLGGLVIFWNKFDA